ncbi:hexokinase [Ephemerocybe angulata]|uniref:Phosphotransferase n=1 Tax=Ephemerocybe angulata TaxID=980116 RepID=A0A8H6ICE0_9AGAR|nr:hexokinase [Tulosesus angulatus]
MPSISALQFADAQSVLDNIERQFTISDDTLVEIAKGFLVEFEEGLNNYGKDMAMIPTFVTGVPDGTEQGTFLALDLGGTNLRVCEVVLNGDKTFNLTQKKFKVSDTLKQGEASALFNYIAESVDSFMTTHSKTDYTTGRKQGDSVYLGFTFSFPVEQTALDRGKILTWTKGFSAKNAVDHDVVQLLQDAFDRKHMHVKCVALVNDTVGTLLTRAYISGGALIGAIFGTGTNGAYVEDIAKLKKLDGSPAAAKGGHMVINCEWGAFDNSRTYLPMTPYDNTLDRLSINPKYQTFEKFISGMYLGEIVRHIILSLVDAVPQAILFKGKSTSALNEHYGLDTAFMSAVEAAWIGEDQSAEAFELPPLGAFDDSKLNDKVQPKLQRIKTVIAETLHYKPEDISFQDAAIVRSLCALVANRAAALSGTAVAAVLVQTHRARLPGDTTRELKHQNESVIGVGVDGSLVEHYPAFQDKIRATLRNLVGEDVEKRVDIGLAKDGSGVGAALCALQALKQ